MPASISAARFEKAFNDSTLRLDYIVGGDARQASIMLHGMSKQDGWAGRRVNLSRVPYTGYG
ncbi:MAG: peptidase M64, partial [Muribaculaceae bacterium]|nr:peptidase M64 [Muribaculaceae bacterium]